MPSPHNVTASPILVALDYHDLDSALRFVDQIDPRSCRLKVGKEMFTLFGPSLVNTLQQRGFEIFLDLKFPRYSQHHRSCRGGPLPISGSGWSTSMPVVGLG
ncbi:Orotidine 5'-phosphate decarboxylase [Pantoea agglomerans]|uniref:Orotidine 5'-phosphate decarboxylase n=1 Tax=Enterobacter agglomerans TaxID=549 RepID=A0A379AFB5_ENTAG|nr:Orotidine 5'-phosphate decarboxylase [Pantoea agglomerans]